MSTHNKPSPLKSDQGRDLYIPQHDAKYIEEKMNKVKLQHRSEFTLEDWNEYKYADKFPAQRENNVKWLETVDALYNKKKHEQAVTDMTPIESYLDTTTTTIVESEIVSKKKRQQYQINDIPTTRHILEYVNSVDRYDESELSVEDFKRKYETPSLPVMVTGLTKDWPSRDWTAASFLQSKYAPRRYRIGDDDNGRSIRVPYDEYLQYMFTNKDDSPLYLFEDSFDDDEVAIDLLDEYKVPKYFQEDMFPLLPHDRRPPFRWILIGSERSGTRMHLDPLSTSAWNVVLTGHKRWVLMSPKLAKDLAFGRNVLTQAEKDRDISFQAVYWFEEILPRIRSYIVNSGREEEYRLMEFIQYPGEVVFVPSGWWHAVINLTDSVSFTQNWVSTYNFPSVWRDMKSRRKHLARRLLQRLRFVFPQVAAVAQTADELAGYTFNSKKSKRTLEKEKSIKKIKMGNVDDDTNMTDTEIEIESKNVDKQQEQEQEQEDIEKLRTKKKEILKMLRRVNENKFMIDDIDTPSLQPVFDVMLSGESDSSSDSDDSSDDDTSDEYETDSDNDNANAN